LTVFQALIAYARGHNLDVGWNMIDDYSFKDAVKKELATILDEPGMEDELKALLLDKTTYWI